MEVLFSTPTFSDLLTQLIRYLMFSNETAYKLSEFIILEHNRILLTWLLQSPMGMQRSGKCYAVGDILVIMLCHLRDSGYLRFEYFLQLHKLPYWHKTTYYCHANSLRQVTGGQSLTTEMIEQLAINAFDSGASKEIEPGTFRLGRHKIIINNENEISWQAMGLSNKVNVGKCSINSGVLILESGKQELEHTARKSFYEELGSLPLWNKTTAWAFSGAVKHCKDPQLSKIVFESEWQSKTTKRLISESIPLIFIEKSEAEKYSKIRLPRKENYKIEWGAIFKLTNQKIKKSCGRLDSVALFIKEKLNYAENKWNVVRRRKNKSA
jgi:hypothetical protein